MVVQVLVPCRIQRSASPVQQEILQSGLLSSGFSCVLQMPTGSGKTWLAEQAIATVLEKGKRAVYLTPLRALADELTARWQARFAPTKVGVFTGDYANRSYPVPYQDAQLLVMTPERLDACTRNWRSHWHWIPEVDLVVVDELHLLGEPRRGARLEGALLRLMRLNPFVRVLGLSATLGNREELADWLGGVEYHSNLRPVPLEWKVVRYKRAQDKPDFALRELRRNLAINGKSLVFVQSRRRAEELAAWFQETGLRTEHHHAGLNHAERRRVENRFRSAELDVLVATATLEMGLNLPACQVILYDLQTFDGCDFVPLSVNSVWQRAGRAGRPGLDLLGEVVLLAPSWDGQAEHYPKGKFEQIRSGLARTSALAEQIIAEVASGLCKSHAQLEAIFSQSLASQQDKLPSVNRVVDEMLEAGMLALRETEGSQRLRTTRLGFVAVRHLLSPETILLFRRVLESYDQLTFLDLLLIATSSEDCEPILPVDFEQLDPLSDELSYEPTLLLELSRDKLRDLLGIDGKRLLAAIHTAMTARDWTRLGDAAQVADKRGCYAFEVHRLQESVQRSLQAMSAVLSAIEAEEKPLDDPELVPLRERIQALGRMVGGGLDERTATLTVIPGIGAKLAKRLNQSGIADIEDLALADAEELADNPRISINRAQGWIERAAEIVDSQWSAYRYREESTQHRLKGADWPTDIDPYRLRRATSLQVEFCTENTYRVTGGLDPHTVTVRGCNFNCDCADHAKENICKHILAVRLKRKDSTLHKLSQVLNGMAESTELNLLELWMGNHR